MKDLFSIPDGYEIAGTASYIDYIVRLKQNYDTSGSDIPFDQNSWAVIIHEALHYFQFVSSLDGISWFLFGLDWTDKLRDATHSYSGKIKIPLTDNLNDHFLKSIERFSNFKAHELLHFQGNPELRDAP